MRIKVGTILDERIFRQAKAAAARQGKSLARLIEEALEEHLAREEDSGRRLLTLDQVMAARGGAFADRALGGTGAGDFDDRDID